ncbi:DMT family transporter [Roseibium marinum]|uniref:Drug/metabolite transporter (DMT)-like permease n=1 Tax=Roseibium marinum TaxID=281252 RepID=A0A2S3UL57_9HYPH|nr:DMT family transporter [Roseibium marinum]POF28444.1 drug/metabolite transporter (DMT)-like permease [Roseibium marinum]
MSLRNWILLSVLGVIWGGSFLFAKVAVAEIPPFVLVFFRVSIACAALLLYLWHQGLLARLELRLALPFLILGLLNNAIPFSLLFLGQTVIGAGLASILNATTPIFTVLVAGVLVKQETLQAHRIAGVVLGIAGVAVMLSGSLSGLATDPVWAQLCCLGAAISYACAATFARRFKSLPPQVSATGQLMGSSVIMLPVALLTSSGWALTDASPTVWLNVAALGLVATAIAYLIYFQLLADAGATNASLVTLLVPASALFLGWLILGEKLDTIQLGGFAILLAGLVVLDGRILQRLGNKPA